MIESILLNRTKRGIDNDKDFWFFFSLLHFTCKYIAMTFFGSFCEPINHFKWMALVVAIALKRMVLLTRIVEQAYIYFDLNVF